jgi:hypothetical protein
MSYRRSRKDNNHDQLANLFRQMGCSAIDMVDTGIPGWPDMAVGVIGKTHLVEVKNVETAYGRSGLNANQTAFARDWRGEPVEVVCTTEDVIALVNKWRKP